VRAHGRRGSSRVVLQGGPIQSSEITTRVTVLHSFLICRAQERNTNAPLIEGTVPAKGALMAGNGQGTHFMGSTGKARA
jgi:hypothetical protein